MSKPTKLVIDLETGTETVVELDAAEVKQQKADAKAVAAAQADADKQAAEHDKLLARLSSGKASDAEVQAALAKLLAR